MCINNIIIGDWFVSYMEDWMVNYMIDWIEKQSVSMVTEETEKLSGNQYKSDRG